MNLYKEKGSQVSERSYLSLILNDKILDLSKLKAFADDKVNITEKIKFVLERVKNVVGKADAVTSIFSLSHNVFKSFLRVSGIVW